MAAHYSERASGQILLTGHLERSTNTTVLSLYSSVAIGDYQDPATVVAPRAWRCLHAVALTEPPPRCVQGRVVLLNPSGPGVSDEIASALRRDDELIDLKVSRLREKVCTSAVDSLVAFFSSSYLGFQGVD